MHVSKKHITKVVQKKKRNLKKNRKRLFVFWAIILVFIFGISIRASNFGNKNKFGVNIKEKIDNIEKKENPRSKITIVVDPGHGHKADMTLEKVAPWSNYRMVKSAVGAIGTFSTTPEYQINLEVGIKLNAILKEKGYNVIMTKTNLEDNPSGIERAEIGNKANARLAVRIHADSFKDTSIKGTSILVPSPINDDMKKISGESERCGQIIMESLVNRAGVKSRGIVKRKNLTTFNWSKVPTILIEMGFLSNKEEDTQLNNDEYQNKIAIAIAEGIEEALMDEIGK